MAADLAWAADIGGAGLTTYLRSDSTRQGDLVTAGIFAGQVDVDPSATDLVFQDADTIATGADTFVARYNGVDKSLMWGRQLKVASSGTAAFNDIAIDSQDNVWVTHLLQSQTSIYFPRSETPGDGFTVTGDQGKMVIAKLDGATGWATSVTAVATPLYLAADGQGAIYLSGAFTSKTLNVLGASFSNSGASAAFVAKFDEALHLQWSRQLTGSGSASATGGSVSALDNGDLVWTGGFSGKIDLNPGPGVYNSAEKSGQFVVHLSGAGAVVWAGNFASASSFTMSNAVADDAGNVYLSGSFSGSLDVNPSTAKTLLSNPGGAAGMYLVKLNGGTGGVDWSRAAVGGDGRQLLHTADDAIVLRGGYSGSQDIDFGPGTELVSGGHGFLAEYGIDAALHWGTSFDYNGNVNDAALLAGDTEVAITGSFFGLFDFDPGPGETWLQTPASNDRDCYAISFSRPPLVTQNAAIAAAANEASRKAKAAEPASFATIDHLWSIISGH